jgi:hypothetical protein
MVQTLQSICTAPYGSWQSIMQVQRFEIAVLSFNCQSSLKAALALFKQFLDSLNILQSSRPSSNSNAVISCLGRYHGFCLHKVFRFSVLNRPPFASYSLYWFRTALSRARCLRSNLDSMSFTPVFLIIPMELIVFLILKMLWDVKIGHCYKLVRLLCLAHINGCHSGRESGMTRVGHTGDARKRDRWLELLQR